MCVLWNKKEREGEGLSYSDKTLCLSVGNCRSSSNCMSSLNDGALNSYTFHTIVSTNTGLGRETERECERANMSIW